MPKGGTCRINECFVGWCVLIPTCDPVKLTICYNKWSTMIPRMHYRKKMEKGWIKEIVVGPLDSIKGMKCLKTNHKDCLFCINMLKCLIT